MYPHAGSIQAYSSSLRIDPLNLAPFLKRFTSGRASGGKNVIKYVIYHKHVTTVTN